MEIDVTKRFDSRTEVHGLIKTHTADECVAPCPIHAPSDHHMASWPMIWRDDRKIIERLCAHGIGHPDPDDRRIAQGHDPGIHGCDGCCHNALRQITHSVPQASAHVVPSPMSNPSSHKLPINDESYSAIDGMHDIITAIRMHMQLHGVTQHQLARAVGAQQSTISAILNVKHLPSMVMLLKILHALELTFIIRTNDNRA